MSDLSAHVPVFSKWDVYAVRIWYSSDLDRSWGLKNNHWSISMTDSHDIHMKHCRLNWQQLTFSPWGGMANCNSRTEGLPCSTCDRRTGYRRFCRGSAAVRSSCGMESSRWELMIIGFPRWNCLLLVRWGWPRRSASRWIGRWYGRKLLIRPFLNAIGIQLIAEDKDLDVPGKWESESHPIKLGADR